MLAKVPAGRFCLREQCFPRNDIVFRTLIWKEKFQRCDSQIQFPSKNFKGHAEKPHNASDGVCIRATWTQIASFKRSSYANVRAGVELRRTSCGVALNNLPKGARKQPLRPNWMDNVNSLWAHWAATIRKHRHYMFVCGCMWTADQWTHPDVALNAAVAIHVRASLSAPGVNTLTVAHTSAPLSWALYELFPSRASCCMLGCWVFVPLAVLECIYVPFYSSSHSHPGVPCRACVIVCA